MASRPHIMVATHHKGGTVWMMTTFIRIAKANAWRFIHLNEGESGWSLHPDKLGVFEARRAQHESEHPEEPGIFFEFHGAVPDLSACKASRGVRGLRIVRDPRDMLLSAVRFHLKANEPWLDEPDPALGGRTFRQCLEGLGTLRDRIAFELDTHMGRVIRDMAGFDDQGVFQTVRYEDLITDYDMRRFHEVLAGLGLEGREIINGLDAYWRSSLFGDRSEADKQATRTHVSDSSPAQWRSRLGGEDLRLIESRVGDAIERLGYALS